MPKTIQLNTHGLIACTGYELADARYGPLLEKQVAELEQTIDTTLAKRDEVHQQGRSGRLTQLGIGETLATISEAAARRIMDQTQARRAKLDQDVKRADMLLEDHAIDAPENGTGKGGEDYRNRRDSRYREIREALGEVKDRLTREADLQQSIRTDPIPDARDLVLALQTAPAMVRRKLVSEEAFQTARIEYLKRANPEAIAGRSAALAALSAVTHNMEAAIKAVSASAGLAAKLKHDMEPAA